MAMKLAIIQVTTYFLFPKNCKNFLNQCFWKHKTVESTHFPESKSVMLLKLANEIQVC